MHRWWSDVTPGQRAAVVTLALVETVVKAAMVRHLRTRDPEPVCGPKWAGGASTLVSPAGLVPAACFEWARRRKD